MGIEIRYNEAERCWELSGFGFRWKFETEEEAKAERSKAWKHHFEKLHQNYALSNILLSYRY